MAGDGWYPKAIKRETDKRFDESQAKPVKAVALHIAQGKFWPSVDWLSDKHPESGVSSHFVVSFQGEVVQLVSIHDRAWANGLTWKNNRWYTPGANGVPCNPSWADIIPGINPNLYTISIEHEGYTGVPLPAKMKAATAELMQWIKRETDLAYVPARTLIGHFHINPVNKPGCPGAGFDFNYFAAQGNGPQPPALPAIEAYYQANGGSARYGQSLTGERLEVLENGLEYTVRYFERALLHWRPGEAVGEGRLGYMILHERGEL